MDNTKSLSTSAVLITGGHGLLGEALHRLFPNAHRPRHHEMDIRQPLKDSLYIKQINPNPISTVIHCAALKMEPCTSGPIEGMLTNVVGTANVSTFCHDIGAKMVYISTYYVFRGDRGNYKVGDEVGPMNYYAETKLAGEYVAKSVKDHLIIRLSFFPDIFPHEQAYQDQFSTRLTASEAATKITALIELNAIGTKHVCGPKRSIYEFAVATSGGRTIKPILLSDDTRYVRPRDTSLEE